MLVDNLGTVRDLMDKDGNLVAGGHYRYDAFGNILQGDTSLTRYLYTAGAASFLGSGSWIRKNSALVRLKFCNVSYVPGFLAAPYTAREFDRDTGLQYNRNRWYDPATGRWLSEDPIGFAGGDSNLYRYVGNSPTNYRDPSGLLHYQPPPGFLEDPAYDYANKKVWDRTWPLRMHGAEGESDDNCCCCSGGGGGFAGAGGFGGGTVNTFAGGGVGGHSHGGGGVGGRGAPNPSRSMAAATSGFAPPGAVGVSLAAASMAGGPRFIVRGNPNAKPILPQWLNDLYEFDPSDVICPLAIAPRAAARALGIIPRRAARAACRLNFDDAVDAVRRGGDVIAEGVNQIR